MGVIQYTSRRIDANIQSGTSTSSYYGGNNAGQAYINPAFANIIDYGAVADDTTDCYAAIMATITALNNGGTILIPEGTFKIRNEIELNALSGYRFLGVGEKSIIHAEGFNGRHFRFTDCDSIVIEDMKLIGDTIDSSLSTGGIYFRLVNNDNTAYNVLRNLYITDITNTAVTMNTPILTVIENVVGRMCLGDCFYVWGGTSVVFNSCYAVTSTECGFNLYNMTYCSLNGCAAEVNGVGYNFENSKAIVLNGCGCEDPIHRSTNFPGYAYQVISGSVVTAIGCYNRGADAVGDCRNIEVGSRFDVINFKDNDASDASNTTDLNTLHIDVNGNIKLDSNVEFGSSSTNGKITQHYYGGDAAYRGNWTHSGYWGFGPTNSNYIIKIGSTDIDGVFTNSSFRLHIEGSFEIANNSEAQTESFTAMTNFLGANGAGWKISSSGGVSPAYTLEIDHVRVRGSITATEFILNKIRCSNGSVWITDGVKVKSGLNYGSTFVGGASQHTNVYYFVGEDTNPFVAHDIIKSQAWSTMPGGYSGIWSITYLVTRACDNNCIEVTDIDGNPPEYPYFLDSKDFVRMGNTTDTTRQGALYLTASDSNNPYLEVYDGLSYNMTSADVRVRLGRLNGITLADTTALTGFGLYTSKAYLENVDVRSGTSGKRIVISSTDNRMTFYSANGDTQYLRIDDNIYGSGQPGIAIVGSTSIYCMLTNEEFEFGADPSHGIHLKVTSSSTSVNFNGLAQHVDNSETDWRHLLVRTSTGEVRYYN